MERVVSVNLNGRAYQLEEAAYDALRAYMARAEDSLDGNPDRSEIVGDLEQAIADKCATYMSAHKQVVTGDEMTRILSEMGPVGGEEAAHAEAEPRTAAASSGAAPRKRLYRLKEGAQISGVCTGLAAYFDLDVNVIRVIWILAAIFTNLLAVLVYIIMMFVIPSASTSEEWAAAHGVPFNAQGVIDEAKRRYSDFEARGGWRQWKWARKAERRYWREQRSWRRQSAYEPGPPVGYVTQIFAGLIAITFGIVSAALTIAFLAAIFSLVTTGAVLGFAPIATAPIWVVILALALIYSVFAFPLRAIRRASYRAISGRAHGDDPLDGLVTLLLIALFVWLAWRFIPEAHLAIEQAIAWLRHLFVEVQS